MAKIVNFSNYVKGKGDDMEMYHLHTFAYDATQYESYISETAQAQLQSLQKSVSDAILSKDPTIDSNKIITLTNYMNAAKGIQKKVQIEQIQPEGEKILTRTPTERRAGFINASILLYAIMNIAIIIAITVFLL